MLSLHIDDTHFLFPVTAKSQDLLNISYETTSQNKMNFNQCKKLKKLVNHLKQHLSFFLFHRAEKWHVYQVFF